MKKWLAVSGVLISVGFMSPSASAQGVTECGHDHLQPFAAWGDNADYWLAPAGSFEDGATGWSLEGGATVESSENPLNEGSRQALSLPAGSTATTPPICVEPGSPHSRMFARTTAQNPDFVRGLRVELIHRDAITGEEHTRPAGRLTQQASWAPTEKFSLGGPPTTNPGGFGTTVHYRFIPRHETAWHIDDLYIDPKRK